MPQIQGMSQIQGMPQIQEMPQIQGQLLQQQMMPQMAQQQMIMNSGHHHGHGRGFKLLHFASPPNTKGDEEKEGGKAKALTLAAVIITICDGSSYDTLFSSVKQDVGDQGRVAVYSCSSGDIKDLMEQITDFDADKLKKRKDDLDSLLDDLKEIGDPSCA